MDLISIVDCGLCLTLPRDEKVEALPLPEAWAHLTTILARRGWGEPWSADLTRFSSALDVDLEQIRVCRACGTHYHYHQFHEPHFSEPREPETDWFLRRLTPTDARVHYLDRTGPDGVVEHLDGGWLEERYETIIELLRRDLPRAPDWQIERHVVEALYMYSVDRHDWEGLRATLIDHPDRAYGVYVADRMFSAIDPEHPARGLASSLKYLDDASALLAAEPTREPLLVAVLAAGLSAQGQIMQLFLYPTRWEPVTVASYAMCALRTHGPRRGLAPAIAALAKELERPNPGWREMARDLLMEYLGAAPERANEVLAALVGDTPETLAVRTFCQARV